MAETGLVQILEGALMVAGEALSIQRLSQLFDETRPTDPISPSTNVGPVP